MSLAKKILDQRLELQSWQLPNADLLRDFRTIVVHETGVSLSIFYRAPDQIFWSEKGDMLSTVEKNLLEHLARYLRQVKSIPSLRELDFYLRDHPKTPAWPSHFNVQLVIKILDHLTSSSLPLNDLEVTAWLSEQLRSIFPSNDFETKLMAKQLWVIFGPKSAADEIEKKLTLWQEQLRSHLKISKLLILYSIKI